MESEAERKRRIDRKAKERQRKLEDDSEDAGGLVGNAARALRDRQKKLDKALEGME